MTWAVSLENIAGIRQGSARLEPGVNAVRASNWQGKSSFLAGIKTAFGTATTLTEGQSSGRVVLQTDEDELTVELDRANGTIARTGSPYLDEERDRVCAALFAFLDEDNEVRHAARTGQNLGDILTRPLDFENIEEQIATLRSERDAVERERDRAAEAADRLPTLQKRVTTLEADLDALREKRDAIGADASTDSEVREELSTLRAERDQVGSRIERLEATVERVRETLAAKREERDSLTVPPGEDVEAALEQQRADLRDIERDAELLQSVYEANKRVLDEERVPLLTEVTHDIQTDAVTCWLCGEDATRADIEAALSALDDRIADRQARADDIRERVADLEAERETVTEARRRQQDLTNRIAELESRRAETDARLESARAREEELDARIEDLAAAADAQADRRTDLESEIKYTEAELDDARADVEEMEARAAQRSTLDAEYDSLTEDIEALRNRKERVERQTRQAFSTAMADLLERFNTGFETARLTSTFDLVVARDGRETAMDALSEGERELLGIVAALAGHETFAVAESVPVMLLDGLGGLASDNLQTLVSYLADRTEYLVLTAYPEHAAFDGNELFPTDWQVVSNAGDVGATT